MAAEHVRDDRRREVVLDGGWRAAVADEELRRRYPDDGFDDGGWASIDVPGHWRSHPAFAGHDGSVLYRTRFDTPAPFGPADAGVDEWDRRTFLVLDGIFSTSDVWLDGTYVGDTEGTFFPHAFEITDALGARSEHTLALEVGCRPEGDLRARRSLVGAFQQSDVVEPGWNPGGIWRPVRLEQSGPVRIRHFRALCRDADAQQATVFVRAVLDALDATTVEVVSWLTPHVAGPVDPRAPRQRLEHRQVRSLAAGENRVEWTIAVAQPRLWWPHALGDQPLHDLHVEVRIGGDAAADDLVGRDLDRDDRSLLSDRRTRRLGLRRVTRDGWVFSVNGERLFLKGANLAPTRQDLAAASPEEVARDITLARDAGLDLLRVRAHVARPELYDAADEAGLLLWQDLPLRGRVHRSARAQGRRQARELVDLLAHHPSILLWCGHDDPSGTDEVASFGRAVLAQARPSYSRWVVDHAVRNVLGSTDPSRPVVAHSGVLPHPPQLDGTDSHLWFGWRYGDPDDLARWLRRWPRIGRFVSAFGRPGAPGDDDALAQQAEVARRQIEALRLCKYAPTGGFAHLGFADAFATPPDVPTAGVLDHDRRPRPAHAALRAACQPVIAVASVPAEVEPGARLEIPIHVVSDARIAHSDMVCRVHLSQMDRGAAPTRHWRFVGDVPADACVRVGSVPLVAPDAPGELALDLELAPADPAAAAAGTGFPVRASYVVRVRSPFGP